MEKKSLGQKVKDKVVGNLQTLEKVFVMIETFMEDKVGLKKNRKTTMLMLASLVVVFGSIDINVEALIAGAIVLGVMMMKEQILKNLSKKEEAKEVSQEEEKAEEKKESEEK